MEGDKDQWAAGAWVSSDPHQMMVNNMVAYGHARGFAEIIAAIENIKLEDEKTDGE